MQKIECTYSGFGSHSTINDGKRDMKFTRNEIIHAAYTVGKQNSQKVIANEYYSIKEVDFRISMIQAFLDFNKKYITRTSIFNNLDPSEKGSINYFLGNVFCKLISQKVFYVKWLIHLDLFVGSIDNSGQRKRPDFVGKRPDSTWIAVESKCRQVYAEEVKSQAVEQLKYLKSIDGTAPSTKLASILHGKDDEFLHLDIIDPIENEDLMVEIDKKKFDYARDYYAQVYAVIKQNMERTTIDGREFAVRQIHCHNTTLGIDLYIYNKIADLSDTSYITRDIEEYLNNQSIKSRVNLKETEEYFIGLDGIYVKYHGK